MSLASVIDWRTIPLSCSGPLSDIRAQVKIVDTSTYFPNSHTVVYIDIIPPSSASWECYMQSNTPCEIWLMLGIRLHFPAFRVSGGGSLRADRPLPFIAAFQHHIIPTKASSLRHISTQYASHLIGPSRSDKFASPRHERS